jgi:hypothetical protein
MAAIDEVLETVAVGFTTLNQAIKIGHHFFG